MNPDCFHRLVGRLGLYSKNYIRRVVIEPRLLTPFGRASGFDITWFKKYNNNKHMETDRAMVGV